MRHYSDFSEAVRDAVRQIPRGETRTYKEVAEKAGNPAAARAVGMIMSKNIDRSVPCHRVVRSDGKLGGYNGIRGGLRGIAAKAALLKHEGYKS